MPRNRLLVAAAIVAAFALGLILRGGGGSDAPPSAPAEAAAPTIWTCSMHPQIRLPAAGKCPICFMDLIPLERGEGEDEGPRVLAMSAAAAALAEIRTVPVAHRDVAAEVRLIGTVVPAETRQRTIAARVAGRIDTLFVDFTGTTVHRGEPLAALYSPALLAAQTELITARAAERALGAGASQLVREATTATVTAARRRLRLWGFDDDQVAEIERRGAASDHLRILAPLGGVVLHKHVVEGMYVQEGTPLYTVADLATVWIEMEAFETDLAWLRLGQDVVFTTPALPGRELGGRIDFIDPVVSERRRTARVRLEADNRDGALKPGMYVDGVVAARPAGEDAPLVIPASAPLITGKRAVVYVQLPDRARPTFEGREVELGPRAGAWYIVRSGVAVGEAVVANGAFKIDSALQIQAKPSMMNPPAVQGAAPALARVTAPAPFLAALDSVLAAYVDVQRALAGDDDAAAREAAARTVAALDAVPAATLAAAATGVWRDAAEALAPAADRVAAAAGIEERRRGFEQLSTALWRALQRFGTARPATVRLFHCPMAHDNTGADWIQLETVTANPYFGASMLRCGSQTDSLVADPEGG